jgi:hypothetical protein
VSGSSDGQVNTIFVPVVDKHGNMWLEADDPGRFQRIAILGQRIVGISENACTKLAEAKERTELEPMADRVVEPLPAMCDARRHFAARLRDRKAQNQNKIRDSGAGAKRAPVQVTGAKVAEVDTIFFPVFDDQDNEWLQSGPSGEFERIALVGKRFYGFSGATCTELKVSGQHRQTELLASAPPARAAPITSCDSAMRAFRAIHAANARKPNEARDHDDRRSKEKTEAERIGTDLGALTGAEPKGKTLLDLRIERARAATEACKRVISAVYARTWNSEDANADKKSALWSDMILYLLRDAIAESLLAAIGRHPEGASWAAIATEGIGAPAAFGSPKGTEKGAEKGAAKEAEKEADKVAEKEADKGEAVAAATTIFAAVRGLHEPAAPREHAALLGALNETAAGRIVRKALVPTLPFGRALVAAVGAACARRPSRPSFGRSYV